MRNQPAILLILFFISFEAYSQCSTLRQQRNITFNTDKDCAPVSVTDFTITYFFNVPQDPSQISIRFEWNDPGNNVDEYSLGDPEFAANATNTEFTAVGTFTYPENNQCVFLPESTIIVNGERCETSTQTQVVTSWARDNDFGGNIQVAPGVFDVCYNNAVDNAIFTDNSTFNCNINQEPDNPNRQARYTQFVYGTNHNATNSIRDLSLVDAGGSTVSLTDNSANLSAPQTVNGVTATYFGDIVGIPFPADGPELISLPISAPANAANVVGSSFEITLYNWNICNPFNGDYTNPNYADAVSTTAYITIVNPPVPDFLTRLNDSSGELKTIFCLGETIYFDNETTGGNSYRWEFYDDAAGTTQLSSSSQTNPTFVYNTPGQKLIRLYAENTGAEGDCQVLVEKVITLSPAAVAQIGLFDETFTSNISNSFCIENGSVTIGFRDETVNVEPETEWRWEFYDVEGALAYSIPSGSDTYGASVTDFYRTFTEQGTYLVRLIARNNTSQCMSIAEEEIFLYDIPDVSFSYTEVCEGQRTVFYDIPASSDALGKQVNGDTIALYEWDFSYDGVSFNSEIAHTSNDAFEFYLDGKDVVGVSEPLTSSAGTFAVALRMTSSNGGCSDVYTANVIINPRPVPELTSDYLAPICPGEEVRFYNNSNLTAADYKLIITDSLVYYDTLAFNSSDSAYIFENTSDSTRVFYASLIGMTSKGCLAQSDVLTIQVMPSFSSGFRDINYSVVSGNCSVWESILRVNAATQALDADQYLWTVEDENATLAGYPITKTKGDAGFHELAYSLTNTSGVNKVFTVHLEVVKEGMCVRSSENTYIINPQPLSGFSIEEREDCTYETIVLEAEQKGLTAYEWDIYPEPDQHLSEDDQQTLIYFRPSQDSADLQVNVSLVTQNLAGCSSDTTESSVVVEALEEQLSAYFEVGEDTILLPNNTVDITNLSSQYEGVRYVWDFGNGESSESFDPGNVTYNSPGIYEISLAVRNSYCEELYHKSIVVEPADPVIDFYADTLQGCAPLTVHFTNTSQFAESGTFYWEFGDGKTSPADDASHTFVRPGVYTVTLYGENRRGTGSIAVREDYITVFEQPIANFSLSPSTVFIPDNPVYFRNSSENSSIFQWNFGDGYTSNERNPIHYFESEGNFDIVLIAQTDSGCLDTLMRPAAVKAVKGGNNKTPNAFSPSKSGPGSANGSGETINDVFIPKVEGVTAFRMLIYNKWGQLLFESLDKHVGWDGYYRGLLQPSDVYVYKLELTYSDGRYEVKIGDVTLIR